MKSLFYYQKLETDFILHYSGKVLQKHKQNIQNFYFMLFFFQLLYAAIQTIMNLTSWNGI